MKFRKNSSVFRRWLWSYLIMLGLMVVASSVLYLHTYDAMVRQQERVNEIMLEKIQAKVDENFESAKDTVISLYMDSEVHKLMKTRGGFAAKDYSTIYSVYEQIRSDTFLMEEYNGIFVYFLHTDTVLFNEGHVDKELFYDLYYEDSNYSQEEFDSLMNQSHSGHVVNVKHSDGKEELIFLRNTFARGDNELDATFGISISGNEIIELMEKLKWKDHTEVLVLYNNEIICSNGNLGEALLGKYTIEELVRMDVKEQILLNDHYYLVSTPSANAGFHYIALTPQQDLQEEAKRIQEFMIVLMAVFLAVGILIAYYLTRINYNPLKEVVDAFGEFDHQRSGRNEYEWLLGRKKHFTDEYQEAKRKISEKDERLRQQYLYRLVVRPYDNRLVEGVLLPDETLFEKNNTLVALFCTDVLRSESTYAKLDRGAKRFVFTNVLGELLQGRLSFAFVDVDDSFACIITSDKEILEIREILEEVLDDMQLFMMEHMQTQISVMFGSCYEGMEGIHHSYLMAREAAEYRSFMPDTNYIWYDDIKNRHTVYHYPSETEQKIINAVSVGKAEDACLWIDEIIELNYRDREITLVMKKCLTFEIMGSIIKGAKQGSGANYILGHIEAEAMPEHVDKDTVLDYLHGIANGVCEEIRKNEMQIGEDKQFGWQVMEYVQNNYRNPDLNISITALHFDITPSYLSALFKEQTGLNLLEYINHTRVEHAKKLLEEGCSLNEVCEQTGFRSSGALIRVFKKVTGVTPGQMKKIYDMANKE